MVSLSPNAETARTKQLDPEATTERAFLTFHLPRHEVVVRPLLWRDLRALEWHGGADLRSFYEWEWEQHGAGHACVLVADFNGFPIAQGGIHWNGKVTHPQVPDIQSLRVLPAFQGLGIGSRLLHAAEAIVAGRDHPRLSLSVGIDNTPARRLYERHGYAVVGAPYQDVWHYTDAQGRGIQVEELVVDMVKQLSAG